MTSHPISFPEESSHEGPRQEFAPRTTALAWSRAGVLALLSLTSCVAPSEKTSASSSARLSSQQPPAVRLKSDDSSALDEQLDQVVQAGGGQTRQQMTASEVYRERVETLRTRQFRGKTFELQIHRERLVLLQSQRMTGGFTLPSDEETRLLKRIRELEFELHLLDPMAQPGF